MKKRRFLKVSLSTLLALACLGGNVGAISYTGLGEVTYITRDDIGTGLTYSSYTAQDSSGRKQSAYCMLYDPSAGGVLPIIDYGEKIYGRDRIGSMVARIGSGNIPVLGAINGDFFSMQTGVPLGVMISGGKLVSTDDGKYSIGFSKTGQAAIGKPGVHIYLKGNNGAIEIDQLNKYPTIWGSYLVTEDFASTTLSAVESLEIVLDLQGADITPSGTIGCVIRDIFTGESNSPIPEGCAVLTIALSHEDYPLYTDFKVGDHVELETTCNPGWETVETAIGGGDLILENGAMPDEIVDEQHEKVANPRTAVGLTAEGKVLFFANDGRTANGKGLTLEELSAVMREMGCVTALNLDGGGSTTVMIKRSWLEDCVYVTTPSDGSQRPVSNAILLISSEESDGVPAHLSLSPNSPYVYKGSTVKFEANAVDRAYNPTDARIPGEELRLGFAEQYDVNIGSVRDGAFTAGNIPGEYVVTAKYEQQDGKVLDGRVSVFVTDKIDQLNVSAPFAKVSDGTRFDLGVSASYQGRKVYIDPTAVYYTLDGVNTAPNPGDYDDALVICPKGYITTDGQFRVFKGMEGEVEIGVTVGGITKTILLRIGDAPDEVADFEDPVQLGGFSVSTGGSVSDVTYGYAQGGYKSDGALSVGYTLTTPESARLFDIRLTDGHKVSPYAESVSMWVSGDISGKLTATLTDSAGKTHEIEYHVTKDYSRQLGWSEITADIPSDLRTGMMTLTNVLSITDKGTGTRSIKLDNIRVNYGAIELEPLTGIDGHWAKDAITKLYDMQVITESDCEVTADGLYWEPGRTLTRGEFAKMLVRWRGIDTAPYVSEGITIGDETPEDKIPYIRAAIANGLMNGYGTENGVTLFGANDSLTREAALKVLGSLLDNDGIALKFADVQDISDWAFDGISKCVAAGAVNGYEDNTIRPKNTISRAEMATLLSKLG